MAQDLGDRLRARKATIDTTVNETLRGGSRPRASTPAPAPSTGGGMSAGAQAALTRAMAKHGSAIAPARMQSPGTSEMQGYTRRNPNPRIARDRSASKGR